MEQILPKRSLFDIEADRLRELNKYKNQPEGSLSSKLLGGLVGLIIAVLIVTPVMIYGIFANGFVATRLWAWFVVPVFHAPPLSILYAAGIMLLVRLFIHDLSGPKPPEENENKWLRILVVILAPWFFLLTGYLIHCFLK